jgi:hypothetical protein
LESSLPQTLKFLIASYQFSFQNSLGIKLTLRGCFWFLLLRLLG